MIDDAGRVFGAGDQRDQRVVDHEDARSLADAAHDRAHDLRFVFAIDARDSEADRRRRHAAIADRVLHHLVQHLLDAELARGVEIGAGTASFRDDQSALIREQTHGLRAAGIDADDVHRRFDFMLLSGRFVLHAVPCSAVA